MDDKAHIHWGPKVLVHIDWKSHSYLEKTNILG